MTEMSRQVEDGWHNYSGHMVYTENSIIIKGRKRAPDGSMIEVHPYRYKKVSCTWIPDDHMTIEGFRSGLARGTVRMM